MARTPSRIVRSSGKFPKGKAAESFLLELAERQKAEGRNAESPAAEAHGMKNEAAASFTVAHSISGSAEKISDSFARPAEHSICSPHLPGSPNVSGPRVASPFAAPDPADNPLRRANAMSGVPAVPRGNAPLTVLGIDPGSQCTGWGLVCERSGVLELIDCGAIRPRGGVFAARLGHLFQELSAVVARYTPLEAAIEDVHVAHNVSSALKLGQARGVAVAACAAHGVPVFDWRPTTVKKAVTGTGGADKEQVAWMVAHILNAKLSGPADMTDALAVAVCHVNQRRLQGRLAG